MMNTLLETLYLNLRDREPAVPEVTQFNTLVLKRAFPDFEDRDRADEYFNAAVAATEARVFYFKAAVKLLLS